MTFCASYNDIYEKANKKRFLGDIKFLKKNYEQVACMFQKEGRSLGKHVTIFIFLSLIS